MTQNNHETNRRLAQIQAQLDHQRKLNQIQQDNLIGVAVIRLIAAVLVFYILFS